MQCTPHSGFSLVVILADDSQKSLKEIYSSVCFAGWMPFLTPKQQYQCIEGTHAL